MKKLFVGVAIAVYLLPTLAFAASNTVTLTTDAIITVGGYPLHVSGSTASIESLVVNANNFSVTLSSGSAFTVSSLTLNQLSSDVTTDVVSNICNSSASSISLAYAGVGTVTNIITPSATICTDPTPSTPSAPNAGGGTISGPLSPGYQVGSSTPNASTSDVAPAVPTIPVAPTLSFSRSLRLGMSGQDVAFLQTFLKGQGYYGSTTIVGYFDQLTQEAVMAFQRANGIEPVGEVGPITRARILVIAELSSLPASTPLAPGSFTRDLTLGTQGEDVRLLQKYLNAHGFPVATTGPGSLGNETTYFGPLTQRALAGFQAAHTITPAAGYFGPLTRSYIEKN